MALVIPFTQKLTRYQPVACRLLAMTGPSRTREAMTDQEIAKASGLSIGVIKRLSWSKTWDDVRWSEINAFLKGCNINLEDRRAWQALEWTMKSGKWTHLRRHKLWPYFKTLLDFWAEEPKSTELY